MATYKIILTPYWPFLLALAAIVLVLPLVFRRTRLAYLGLASTLVLIVLLLWWYPSFRLDVTAQLRTYARYPEWSEGRLVWFRTCRGEARLSFNIYRRFGAIPRLRDGGEELRPHLYFNSTQAFAYAVFWRYDASLTHGRFLEPLGFQLCAHKEPPLPRPENIHRLPPYEIYSVTVPYWFLLLLCLPFPALWLRRFLRQRYRRRHGLCLSCGYDLRTQRASAAPDARCPECGCVVTKSKEPMMEPTE